MAKAGREVVRKALPAIKDKYAPDFILGNAENLAGGRGVNEKTLTEMWDAGFHGFTSGNHIWDNKEVLSILREEDRVFRPANYPDSKLEKTPGRGYGILSNGTKEIFIINLMGQVFMQDVECPFKEVDRIISENTSDAPIFLDLHAETTSEKSAMGWYLDGRISAMVGTHTHVQTADNRILPKGTAFITDVGMNGAFDSCIGIDKTAIIKKFVTKRRAQFQPSRDNPGVAFVVITIGDDNRATSIERERYEVQLDD